MEIRIVIDGYRSSSDRNAPLAPALAEPVERGAPAAEPLEEDGYYIVEMGFGDLPEPPVRTVAQHSNGYWFTPGDADYEEGPLPVGFAEYKVIRKIDLWTTELRGA